MSSEENKILAGIVEIFKSRSERSRYIRVTPARNKLLLDILTGQRTVLSDGTLLPKPFAGTSIGPGVADLCERLEELYVEREKLRARITELEAIAANPQKPTNNDQIDSETTRSPR